MFLRQAFLLFKTDAEINYLAKQYDLPVSAINQILKEIYSQIGNCYKVDDFIYKITSKNLFKELQEDGIVIYFLTQNIEVEKIIKEVIESNFVQDIFDLLSKQSEFEKLFKPTFSQTGSHARVYEDFTENMKKNVRIFTNKSLLSMNLKEKTDDLKKSTKI